MRIMMKKTILITSILLLGTLTFATGPVSASSHEFCGDNNQITMDQDPNFADVKENYCDAIEDVDDSKATVENQLADFEEGEDNIDELNQSLHQLKRDQQNMRDREKELIQLVVQDTADGSIIGGFNMINTIQQTTNQKHDEVETLINEDAQVITSEYDTIKRNLRIGLLGSLAGGLLIGSIIGAAVPLVAAKKVENKMRLSSDISFDRKIVIVPSIVGIVLIVTGLVVVTTQIGWTNLVEVVV